MFFWRKNGLGTSKWKLAEKSTWYIKSPLINCRHKLADSMFKYFPLKIRLSIIRVLFASVQSFKQLLLRSLNWLKWCLDGMIQFYTLAGWPFWLDTWATKMLHRLIRPEIFIFRFMWDFLKSCCQEVGIKEPTRIWKSLGRWNKIIF